jgi:aerobic-type carbon monoxide dehydrogenase small subunit (CoxS/CutS family)
VTDFLATSATVGSMPAGGGFGTDEPPRASYTLRVNGVDRPVADAWIGESLLYVLRERLGLAGAKGGCDQGECGACSVQLDGQLTAACLVPAALAADSEIRTVEGLADDGMASDVQRALAESGAVQCGYCVPGLAMAVHDLLERNHQPAELETREALSGNLCRCTGYRGALAAVQSVARSRAEQAEADAAPAETVAAEAAPAESTALIPEQQTQTPPQPLPPQQFQQQPGVQQPSLPQQPGQLPEQPYAQPGYPEQPYPADQAYPAGQQLQQPYPEHPVPQQVPQPQYVGLPQQSGPPDQQLQPQYEYQPTTGLYPDGGAAGYGGDTGGYPLPHQQTTAAPEAGA